MERHSSQSDAGSADAHGVEHLDIHDVEAAASVHQYLCEPLWTDDRVDDKRVSSWVWDRAWEVSLVEGYDGF